ncbi:MAG: sel1 repeat family protein [Erysipelotrichaceae bacterium]|nr:sel1 repeat family protein [Erysipelotrichaceae bacterium]
MTQEYEQFLINNDYDGMMDWAFAYDDARSSRKELKKVAEAYEILISKGYGIAANNLGSMYYCGRYFEEDVDMAIHYYEIACEMGVKMAWGNLGCCYYYGKKKDLKKAYEIFAEGAFLFNDPECLYMLGDMYRDGSYVKKSDIKMMHLYCKALDCVNEEDRREHQCLGDIHYRIGKQLVESANKEDILQGLKHLHVGIGILYERLHENRFVDADIRKYKQLIEETEQMLESEYEA